MGAGCCRLSYFVEALPDRLVVRLDAQGEFVIFLCIIVAAIDERMVGQQGQFQERIPHRPGVTFEDSAAAAGEHGVAGPEDSAAFVICRRHIIAQRGSGMAGGGDDVNFHIADGQDLFITCDTVEAGYSLPVGADDLAAAFFQLGDAGGMVPVVVRDENHGKFQFAGLQQVQYGRTVGWVNRNGLCLTTRIEIHEVIAPCRNGYHTIHLLFHRIQQPTAKGQPGFVEDFAVARGLRRDKLGSFGFVLALGGVYEPKIGFALGLIGFVWVRF